MTPFQVYSEYIALQQHFKLDSYDYFRYNGKTRANEATFNKRNDRYAFIKIARNSSDPQNLILANLVYGKSDYIGTIASPAGHDLYLQWVKRNEGLNYHFKSDLGKLNQDSFLGNLRADNGKTPQLLRLFKRNEVSIETLVIIDALTGCFDRWNTSLNDPYIWPDMYKKCSKYRGFMNFDQDRMFNILRDRFA